MAEGNVADTKLWRCTVLCTMNQQKIQSSVILRQQLPDAAFNAQSAHDEFWTQFDTNIRPVFPIACRIDRSEALELTSKDYFGVERVGVTGGWGGDPTVNGLSGLVAVRSNKRSRQRQGRWFWPTTAVPTNDLLPGNYFNAAQTALDALTARWITVGAGNGWTLVIVSPERKADPAKNIAARPGTWIDAVTLKLNKQASYLRSRKPGVGA